MLLIIVLAIAAVMTGILPGMGSPDTGPGPAVTTPVPTPVHTTPPRTTVVTTIATPVPVKTTTPLPTTSATKTPTPAPAQNATANTSANQTASTSAPPAPVRTVTPSSAILAIGEAAFDGNGTFTVNGISYRDKMSDPTPSYAIGKKYLIVNVTYANLDRNRTMVIGMSSVQLTDIGGFAFDSATDVLLENPWLGTEIGPLTNRTGNMLFLVPPEATFLKLRYTSSGNNTAVFQLT